MPGWRTEDGVETTKFRIRKSNGDEGDGKCWSAMGGNLSAAFDNHSGQDCLEAYNVSCKKLS